MTLHTPKVNCCFSTNVSYFPRRLVNEIPVVLAFRAGAGNAHRTNSNSIPFHRDRNLATLYVRLYSLATLSSFRLYGPSPPSWLAAFGSLLELYKVEEVDYLIDNKVQESQNGSFVCLLCGVVIKVSEWTNQSWLEWRVSKQTFSWRVWKPRVVFNAIYISKMTCCLWVILDFRNLMTRPFTLIKVRNNLRRHFRLRHVEQRERFRCPPCDKVLPNRSSLHNHIYRRHPEWKVTSYDKFAI